MICPRCKERPKKAHFNARWCEPCAAEFVKRPAGKLTAEQARRARALIHTMPHEDIARELGVSVSRLKRWARDHGNIRLSYFNRWHANPRLTMQVCAYYAKHGKIKTAKRFPNVKVRSIVERYFKGLRLEPRQIRWTASQLIELAQMAGLVSFKRQARHFNRPNAREGSIKSAWQKKFGHGGGSINGLSHWLAKDYVRPSCPFFETDYWATRRDNAQFSRKIALWVDVERSLKPDVPEHLRDAISALAKFQRWLHGRNVRQNVKRILEKVG